MQSFPQQETTMLFQGAAGNLELWLTPAPTENARAATAIICHPHPLHGGTMTNKVVTTLAKTFFNLGLRTVRFNFRGVGKSEGVHDEGNGETDDLLAIMQWVKTLFPDDEIWLAGFSFGAFVSIRAATQMLPARLVSVAPYVVRFAQLPKIEITCPWWVVQGEQDEVVEPQSVYEWVDTLTPKPQLIRIPDAGHFFHGKLLELREEITNTLK